MNRKQRRRIRKSQGNPAEFFMKTFRKTVPDFFQRVDGFSDPRNQSYITYPQRVMIGTVLLKNICGIASMNQMTAQFNNEEMIANIGTVCGLGQGLEEIPHFVTVNNYLSRLGVEDLEGIQAQIVKNLVKGRAYEAGKYNGKWLVIVDATEFCRFSEENDDKCLHKTFNKGDEDERTIWSHSVLEAKIVLGDHMVVSICSEFIENNAEDAERQKEMGAEQIKQDCEIKAFRRLSAKLKSRFPRLPICILGDSLYATETLFKICEENGWDYIIRLKDGAMPSVAEEFHRLKDREQGNACEGRKWVNEIVFQDRVVNVVEWEDKGKTFKWVTNITVTKANVKGLTKAGRKRWKIENEGFNNQKNHRFRMEHVCCHSYTAIKNHYMLLQIADAFRQLYELKAYVNRGMDVNIKNISSDLLANFQRLLAAEDICMPQGDEASG